MVSSRAVAFFLQGLVLGLTAAAQPGPLQAYLIAQSVRNGAARTVPVAVVPLVSDPPMVAVVLTALAQVPAGFVRVLQIVGGGVILWLGAGALRALRAVPAAAAERGAPEGPRGFWRAVLVNLTNPAPWIAWSVVMGPIATSAWRASPLAGVAFLAGFYLFLVGGNLALVALAGRVSRMGPGFARGLDLASGVALLAFGLWQVGRGVTGA